MNIFLNNLQIHFLKFLTTKNQQKILLVSKLRLVIKSSSKNNKKVMMNIKSILIVL